MQILWAFRYNPLRIGSSKPTHEIAEQQFHGRLIALKSKTGKVEEAKKKKMDFLKVLCYFLI
ncbi:MAG: hypothetical protein LBK13_03275 [Spirochaetales bacterium]|nr:hypothetical protein [Spirochaetales bacterium]